MTLYDELKKLSPLERVEYLKKRRLEEESISTQAATYDEAVNKLDKNFQQAQIELGLALMAESRNFKRGGWQIIASTT
jgi:hypothetical protein